MNEHKPITPNQAGAEQVAAELSILHEYLTKLARSAPGVGEACEVVAAVMNWTKEVKPLLPA